MAYPCNWKVCSWLSTSAHGKSGDNPAAFKFEKGGKVTGVLATEERRWPAQTGNGHAEAQHQPVCCDNPLLGMELPFLFVFEPGGNSNGG